MRWLDGITEFEPTPRDGKGQEAFTIVTGVLQPMGLQKVEHG